MEDRITFEIQYWAPFRDKRRQSNMATHGLRGFGNMLRIDPNLTTLIAYVKFRAW
jgi:hypothetical protein